MPLVTCPDCGREISAAAPACIHCGRPMLAVPGTAAPPVVASTYPHPSITRVAAEPRYAGFGSRVMAGLVDLVIFLILFGTSLLLSLSPSARLSTRLLSVLASHSYLIVCTALWGQTLGKRAARIQVRSVGGGPVTLGQSFLRELVPLGCALATVLGAFVAYDYLPPEVLARGPRAVNAAIDAGAPGWATAANVISGVYALLDVIVFFVNGRWRALHDVIAGTVVVHTD